MRENFKFLKREEITKLPRNPGVYAFKKSRKFLYIGKSGNIKERVKNHFAQPAYRSNLFLNQVQKVGFIKTDSEIEALLLEAKLIKKYQPKYNVLWRDDKNYFFVAVTQEDFPRIFWTHQPFVASAPQGLRPLYKKDEGAERSEAQTAYIGPFVDGKALKATLKILRKVFPYYTAKKHPLKPCLYCQLGSCPGPNPERKEYKRNITNLINVLKGKGKSVLTNLKKEMKLKSSLENFESAAKIRDQIIAFQRVLLYAKIFGGSEAGKQIHELDWEKTQKILQNLLRTKKKISRVEAYDVSNIQGKSATGSMVTFVRGKPDKNFYRRFKIKYANSARSAKASRNANAHMRIEKSNDVAMIKETLSRRLKHLEWPLPDLILIDGGKAQLNAAKSIITNHRLPIPVTALAKKNNELYVEKQKKSFLLKSFPREIFNFILQLRDEAHRFAITYHRKLRKKALLGN